MPNLCTRCKKVEQIPGRKTCSICLEKQRTTRRRKCAKDFAAGICGSTGCQNPFEPGHVLCSVCLDKKKRSHRTRVVKSRKIGLCVCGSKLINNKCPSCRIYKKEHRHRRKLKVIEHYSKGQMCCSCCGETIIEFLQIDHINGGGNAHRREIYPKDHKAGGAGRTYQWLINNGFPDGFQVLCANCNIGRHINDGICPHKVDGP